MIVPLTSFRHAMHPARRLLATVGFMGLLLLDAASMVQAAELIMFDRAGCPWCRRWDQEVGAIYPKTEEGKLAPLRRVSLDHPLPPDLKLTPPVFYTPTFVLMDDNKEIARITGYMGDDAFWGLLTKLVAPLRRAGPQ